LCVVAVALILPFTPLGALFGFVKLPFMFYLALAGLVALYLALVEIIKRRFYKPRIPRPEHAVASQTRIP